MDGKIKILWAVNTILPEPADALKLSGSHFGGWLNAMLEALRAGGEFEFAVATSWGGQELRKVRCGETVYYLFPLKNNLSTRGLDTEPVWDKVLDEFRPDIVDIQGSEFPWKLALARSAKRAGITVGVTIQGLISALAKYYLVGIGNWDILSNLTLRDLAKRRTLWGERREFAMRGRIEKELFTIADFATGRTTWDRAQVEAMNPWCRYFSCGRILRASFYDGRRWALESAEPHTISLSQIGYPIKGLHLLLRALPLIMKRFPDTKVRIAGPDILSYSIFHYSGYAKYLRRLAVSLGVAETLEFRGILSEKQMCEHYLKSHLFVMPSTIETCPNSLAEAQMLGVPAVASDVGGVADLTANGESLLYRAEDCELLAHYILELFGDPRRCAELSERSAHFAPLRHDPAANMEKQRAIYRALARKEAAEGGSAC